MKSVISISFLCLVLTIVLLFSACGATKTVTQVITAPGSSGAPGATITKTITQVVGTLTETMIVSLSTQAPMVPHEMVGPGGVYFSCFTCHPIPPGHEGRVMQVGLCTQCHTEGPISMSLID